MNSIYLMFFKSEIITVDIFIHIIHTHQNKQNTFAGGRNFPVIFIIQKEKII